MNQLPKQQQRYFEPLHLRGFRSQMDFLSPYLIMRNVKWPNHCACGFEKWESEFWIDHEHHEECAFWCVEQFTREWVYGGNSVLDDYYESFLYQSLIQKYPLIELGQHCTCGLEELLESQLDERGHDYNCPAILPHLHFPNQQMDFYQRNGKLSTRVAYQPKAIQQSIEEVIDRLDQDVYHLMVLSTSRFGDRDLLSISHYVENLPRHKRIFVHLIDQKLYTTQMIIGSGRIISQCYEDWEEEYGDSAYLHLNEQLVSFGSELLLLGSSNKWTAEMRNMYWLFTSNQKKIKTII